MHHSSRAKGKSEKEERETERAREKGKQPVTESNTMELHGDMAEKIRADRDIVECKQTRVRSDRGGKIVTMQGMRGRDRINIHPPTVNTHIDMHTYN